MIPRYQIGISKRTSDWVSVYAVELVAIILALEWAEGIQDRKILICSDSVSSMSSIKSGACKVHHDIIYKILLTNTRLFSLGKEITFMWVPAHVGIVGNEKADKLAKEATAKEQVELSIKLPKSEGKSIIWRAVDKEWQEEWDKESKGRRLYKIQNKVGETRNRGGGGGGGEQERSSNAE